MNEKELEKLAYSIAENTPKHLDQPTTPPIRWRVEGDQLRVLLADGRTVRGPIHIGKAVRPTAVINSPAAKPKK